MDNSTLDAILTQQPDELIKSLSKSSIKVTPWSELVKQYDPLKHKIMDEAYYPKKLDPSGVFDEFKRTPLAFQKMACKKLSQMMFANPVERIYSYDKNNDVQQLAVDILEEIYRVKNNIDAENIERSKKVSATCQCATVWFAKEKKTNIKGVESDFTLAHKSYSEIDGYKLYPITDDYGDLIVLSIGYTDSDNVDHFDIYTDRQYLRFDKLNGKWTYNVEKSKTGLLFMPVAYMSVDEPAWGGMDGTIIVEQLEELESFQGMYINKNSDPTFVMYLGKGYTAGDEKEEEYLKKRKIIKVGEDGFVKDATWQGATEAVSARHTRLRNFFFELIQLADNSFTTMINSKTSADNKELIYADSKAKAIDVGGEWVSFFQREIDIVKEFAKIMFPAYSQALDSISVVSKIKPFSVRSKKEDAEVVSIAGDSMSLETKVRTIGLVNDITQEVETINAEMQEAANQGLNG